MSFHETRFSPRLSFASVAGLERRTQIVTLASGHEERNTPWAQARRRYDAGLGLRSLDDLHAVLRFFEARRGPLYGFRWKDWLDHKSCAPSAVPAPTDQLIGTGDGTTRSFQLVKDYGGTPPLLRPIAKPVDGTLRLAIDGGETAAAVDTTTGLVTLDTPPPPGSVVTAGFEFDTPVRFGSDTLEVNLAAFEAGEIPSIPILEVRL
ncbi:MAG: TIGR02217 family protein [Pikeienuella sp.]